MMIRYYLLMETIISLWYTKIKYMYFKGKDMIIRNAKTYVNYGFELKDIYIIDGRIREISDIGMLDKYDAETDEIIDASGLMAIPGLVDIHFHGAMGHDFCEIAELSESERETVSEDLIEIGLEAMDEIARFEASKGVLAICPATMSYDEKRLEQVMDVARIYAANPNKNSADLVGINMEGPFINPQKAGAQNLEHIAKPDIDMYRRLQKRSNNLIKIVDIAPEMELALYFISKCHDEVIISIAHSMADYDTAVQAFQNGATHMTHLYNAMQGINHREPGPVIAALENNANVELICDGVHVHPAMVRFTFNIFGADKVIMISDSMMACGLSDGMYQLGGQDVVVKGELATLADNPDTIAGSVTHLYDCMKKAVRDMGVPIEDAIRASTENPAKAIGIDKDYGSLNVGCYGNVLLIDENFVIYKIIQKGRVIVANEKIAYNK